MTLTTKFLALATLALGLSTAALAQSADGALRGTVLDSTGALIPQALVTITDADGAAQNLVSDADGAFALTNLAPGTYSVTINAPGFTPTLENFRIEANQTASENVTLGISLAEDVEVSASDTAAR